MSDCMIPPDGWLCTRRLGHDGPCAAVETTEALEARIRADERAEFLKLIEQAEGDMDFLKFLLRAGGDK